MKVDIGLILKGLYEGLPANFNPEGLDDLEHLDDKEIDSMSKKSFKKYKDKINNSKPYKGYNEEHITNNK